MKSSSLNEEGETCGNEVLQIMGKLGRTRNPQFHSREKGRRKVSSQKLLVKFIPQGSFVFIVEFALTSPPLSPLSSQIIHFSPRDPFISTRFVPFFEFSRRRFIVVSHFRGIGGRAPGAGIDRSLSDGGNFAVSPLEIYSRFNVHGVITAKFSFSFLRIGRPDIKTPGSVARILASLPSGS